MDSFLKQIKDNWIILCFITALIVSWTNINTKIVQADKERAELYILVSQIHEIKVSIAVIKEKVTSIEKKI